MNTEIIDYDTAYEWYHRELRFAVDAHEYTPGLRYRVGVVLNLSGPATTAKEYARAAQVIACTRNTCGGPGARHKHEPVRSGAA